MVKVRGKKLSLTTSEYVGRNDGADEIIEEDNGFGSDAETGEVGEVVGNEVLLPETRMSDAPPIKKVQTDI